MSKDGILLQVEFDNSEKRGQSYDDHEYINCVIWEGEGRPLWALNRALVDDQGGRAAKELCDPGGGRSSLSRAVWV